MTDIQSVDAYAKHLGIAVTAYGAGRAEATVTITENHLNPHGTTHGAFIVAVAGAALASAANDSEHTGVVSSLHIDYLRPSYVGDQLHATARVAERLPKEDIFEIRLTGTTGDIVARASGRATRRQRTAQH